MFCLSSHRPTGECLGINRTKEPRLIAEDNFMHVTVSTSYCHNLQPHQSGLKTGGRGSEFKIWEVVSPKSSPDGCT